MGRYFIEISYNGANYSGWQNQTNAPSVQGILESTARQVFRQPIEITGSSRTDAGVHAVCQVAQMDFEPFESLDQHRFKWNMALPEDVAVVSIRKVRPQSQSRYEASSRTYRYFISRRKDPFLTGRSMLWYGPLDVAAMQECCGLICTATDFEAFSKVKTQVNHFLCRVEKACWMEEGHVLIFEIKANRFLRGMVRALVGTMLDVGKGRKSIQDFQDILSGKDRKKAGENVPACGLFLMNVEYDESIYL